MIPREKIIAAVANYGYDWAMKKGQKKGTPPADVHNVSAQEAWLEASDAETDIDFDERCDESALRLLGRKQHSARRVVPRRSHGAEPDAGARKRWASIPSRCGGWARKTARYGRCGTGRAKPMRPKKLKSRASGPGRRRSKGMGEIMRIQSRPAAG